MYVQCREPLKIILNTTENQTEKDNLFKAWKIKVWMIIYLHVEGCSISINEMADRNCWLHYPKKSALLLPKLKKYKD